MTRLRNAMPLIALMACQPTDPGLPPVGAALVRDRAAACEADGGRWGSGGGNLMVCYRDTRDAGRQCSAAGDCDGLCLARSGTCAPVTPLFGCNDILDGAGRRSTICVD